MNKRIKMKSTSAGPDNVFHNETEYEVGTEVSVEEAEAFVRGGYAAYKETAVLPVEKPFVEPKEKAVLPPSETAKGVQASQEEKGATGAPASPEKAKANDKAPSTAPSFGAKVS